MDAGAAGAGAFVVVVEAEVVAAVVVAAVAAEEDEAAAAEEGEAATSYRIASLLRPSSWFIARFTAACEAGQPRVRSVRLRASAAVSGSSNAAVTSGWIGDSRGDGFTVLTCARAPFSSARQHDTAIRDG